MWDGEGFGKCAHFVSPTLHFNSFVKFKRKGWLFSSFVMLGRPYGSCDCAVYIFLSRTRAHLWWILDFFFSFSGTFCTRNSKSCHRNAERLG